MPLGAKMSGKLAGIPALFPPLFSRFSGSLPGEWMSPNLSSRRGLRPSRAEAIRRGRETPPYSGTHTER
jgi:hypothetical protein